MHHQIWGETLEMMVHKNMDRKTWKKLSKEKRTKNFGIGEIKSLIIFVFLNVNEVITKKKNMVTQHTLVKSPTEKEKLLVDSIGSGLIKSKKGGSMENKKVDIVIGANYG